MANETPEGTLEPPGDPSPPEQALKSTCRCEHRRGSLPVVHGPLRARRRLRARHPTLLRAYPRVSRIQTDPAFAIHRPSTSRRGAGTGSAPGRHWDRPAGPARPKPRDRSPIRPVSRAPPPDEPRRRPRANEMPRGTVASFPTHLPPCKHGSRLADASTGGISRFSTAPLGKAYCRWRPHPTGRDLSTSFQVGGAISRGPSTARPRKPC